MNDPRSNPLPGAVIEVSKIVRKQCVTQSRTVLGNLGKVVLYSESDGRHKSMPLACWRKWAFSGRVVARGQG